MSNARTQHPLIGSSDTKVVVFVAICVLSPRVGRLVSSLVAFHLTLRVASAGGGPYQHQAEHLSVSRMNVVSQRAERQGRVCACVRPRGRVCT